MGGICCTAYAIEDSRESPRERPLSKLPAIESVVSSLSPSLRRENAFKGKDTAQGRDGRVAAFEKQGNGSIGLEGEETERKRGSERLAHINHPAAGSVPKAAEGEQVAAGWPAWLAAVAGEAIQGWVPRRADSFQRLDKIGQGTYSSVYRARDTDNKKVVALKKVRFDNLEPESVRFMAREIQILRRLDHANVIKLEGLVTSRMSCSIYLVFEYMEHDLAGLASCPGLEFTEAQVKCYVQQLLCGLDHCHSRNILHRDIKGSNLLIDNNGILKIADFGLSCCFDGDQRHPLTSRVVTLWYRPPELLLGATNYGFAVDLWSAGCVLAELYAGKPIMPGRTEVEQLHKIFKLCGSPSEDYWGKSKLPNATIFKPQQPYRRCVTETFKEFPPPALGLMDILLSIDPADRGTAASALKNEFFVTKPLPCNSSSLPMFPPTKEIDAKIRYEEAWRQNFVSGNLLWVGQERKETRASRAVPAPDSNAELPSSMQKRRGYLNSNCRSEKFGHPEEIASGFPIEPPQKSHALEKENEDTHGNGNLHCRASHSGPLAHQIAWVGSGKDEDASKVSIGADLASLSNVMATRNIFLSSDQCNNLGSSQLESVHSLAQSLKSGVVPLESTRKQDQTSQRKEGRRLGKNDPVSLAHGSKGKKIHYSGPLFRPSVNVEQMLKDHDRQIQEAVRRAQLDRAKFRRLQANVH